MELTREEIEQMPAGIELDRLIALKLLRWQMFCSRGKGNAWYRWLARPDEKPRVYAGESMWGLGTLDHRLYKAHYENASFNHGLIELGETPPPCSTDIAAAWQVVEALTRGYFVQLQSAWAAGWVAVVVGPDPDPEEKIPVLQRPWPKRDQAGAPTAALALCRAALLAHLNATEAGSPHHQKGERRA